jgi:hypothetical protein
MGICNYNSIIVNSRTHLNLETETASDEFYND